MMLTYPNYCVDSIDIRFTRVLNLLFVRISKKRYFGLDFGPKIGFWAPSQVLFPSQYIEMTLTYPNYLVDPIDIWFTRVLKNLFHKIYRKLYFGLDFGPEIGFWAPSQVSFPSQYIEMMLTYPNY